MEPLIISVAVTGGEHGRETTPHLPITPLEIAQSAYEAYEAGASIVHVHVRDDDGLPGHHLERYAFVIDYLAARCDMIVNLTTDPGGEVAGDDRFRSLDLRPELATLDAGTMQAPTGDRHRRGLASVPAPAGRAHARGRDEAGARDLPQRHDHNVPAARR